MATSVAFPVIPGAIIGIEATDVHGSASGCARALRWPRQQVRTIAHCGGAIQLALERPVKFCSRLHLSKLQAAGCRLPEWWRIVG